MDRNYLTNKLMVRRIFYFLSVLLTLLLLCACVSGPRHYHSDDNDFTLSVVEGKDSSLLIFQNQDTVVYKYCLNGCYSDIEFTIPDSTKTIYLLDKYNSIKKVISYTYEIVVVKGSSLSPIENSFLSAQLSNDSCSTEGSPTRRPNDPMLVCVRHPRVNENSEENKLVCFTYPSSKYGTGDGELVTASGYSSFYGTLCERGGGTSFCYCRNNNFRGILKPRRKPYVKE